ncbi:MAG: radical SAM protein, partial [Flavobacterium sp.]
MSGIYIHIPFCKQACHYCDFHFSTSLKKKDEMVLALAKEIQLRKSEFQDEIVETIYFGGGTPSILSIEDLRFLMDEIYRNYKVVENPEITVEANPDDLHLDFARFDYEKDLSVRAKSRTIFEAYKEIGINRLSI